MEAGHHKVEKIAGPFSKKCTSNGKEICHHCLYFNSNKAFVLTEI